jgi:hypothetical protein
MTQFLPNRKHGSGRDGHYEFLGKEPGLPTEMSQ